jgi:uncharacterized C2H2 Zn-finger protein
MAMTHLSHLPHAEIDMLVRDVGFWAASTYVEVSPYSLDTTTNCPSDVRSVEFDHDQFKSDVYLNEHEDGFHQVRGEHAVSYDMGSGQSKDRLVFPRPLTLPLSSPIMGSGQSKDRFILPRPLTLPVPTPASNDPQPTQWELPTASSPDDPVWGIDSNNFMPQYVPASHIGQIEPLAYQAAPYVSELYISDKDDEQLEGLSADVGASDNAKIFICPQCQATFRGVHRRGNYWRHQRLKHPYKTTDIRAR